MGYPTTTSTSTGRRVKVIGFDSDSISPSCASDGRIKCPECGIREMHIYKQDASLYFCGNCAHTIPVVKVKRDTTVGPVYGDSSKGEQKTFIASIPWRRNTDRGRGRGMIIEDALRKRGLQLTDYYEIGPD